MSILKWIKESAPGSEPEEVKEEPEDSTSGYNNLQNRILIYLVVIMYFITR